MDKKLLVGLLAGFLVGAMTAGSASSLFAADVKFSGEYRVRGFLSDNTDATGDVNDTEAITDQRFRLKTTATAGIATAVATVDLLNALPINRAANDAATLQPGGLLPGAGVGYTRFGSHGLGGTNTPIGLREAYMKVTWPELTLALGRKTTKLGHGIILDDTADMGAVMGTWGGVNVTIADLKLFDPQATNAPATLAGSAGADTDAYILHGMLSPMPDNEASVYLAIVADRGATVTGVGTAPNITALRGNGATNANVWVLGGTWDGKMSPFTYGFELDILGGTREKATAGKDIKGLDLLLGGTMDLGMGNVGAWIISGSGQDAGSTSETNVSSISGNYVVGTILQPTSFPTNGDRDGGSINNLFAVKLTAAGTLMDTWAVDGALIFASCSKKTATTAPAAGTAGTVCATDTALGTELDVNAAYSLADNLALSGGLGLLFSGDGWKTSNTTRKADTQSRFWTQLAYNF